MKTKASLFSGCLQLINTVLIKTPEIFPCIKNKLSSALILFSLTAASIAVAQSSIEYQAEDYTAVNGVSVVTNHFGFTGGGFIDYGGNGTWLEWDNVSAGPGTVTLNFRYANRSSSNRQSAVFVNGINTGNVAFASTGSWTNWGTVSYTVTLPLAVNTIRVQANTSAGGPNLDKMDVVSENTPGPSGDRTFDGTVTIQDVDGSGNPTNLEVFGTSNLGPVILDVEGGDIGPADDADYTLAPFLLQHDGSNLGLDGDQISSDATPLIIQNTNANGAIVFRTGGNLADILILDTDGSCRVSSTAGDIPAITY